jgi:hypothetical protein
MMPHLAEKPAFCISGDTILIHLRLLRPRAIGIWLQYVCCQRLS